MANVKKKPSCSKYATSFQKKDCSGRPVNVEQTITIGEKSACGEQTIVIEENDPCEKKKACAVFKIDSAGAVWGSIVGDIKLQEDLMGLLSNYFSIDNLRTSGNIRIVKGEDGLYDISTETFEFEQGEASDTWVIEHNLNKYPSVVTVDSAGRQFQAEVSYDSLSQVTVYINGSTKGKAYLN